MSNVIPFPAICYAERPQRMSDRPIVTHYCSVMKAKVTALEGNRCVACKEILTINKDGERPDGAA